MRSEKRVYGFIFCLVVISLLSVSLVSAFSFSDFWDWLKGLFGPAEPMLSPVDELGDAISIMEFTCDYVSGNRIFASDNKDGDVVLTDWNDATFPCIIGGRTGNGLQLTVADGNYLRVPIITTQGFKLFDKNKGTIDFWFTPNWDFAGLTSKKILFNNLKQGSVMKCGDTGDKACYEGFVISVDPTNGLNAKVMSATTDAGGKIDTVKAGSSIIIESLVWYHVVFTWNLPGEIKLYYEEVPPDNTPTEVILQDSLDNVPVPNVINDYLYIGSNSNEKYQADAIIDDFYIWDEVWPAVEPEVCPSGTTEETGGINNDVQICNYLQNGDFENSENFADSGWGSGSAYYEEGPQPPEPIIVSTPVKSGSKSVKVEATYGSIWVSQGVDIDKSKIYKMSAWFYVEEIGKVWPLIYIREVYSDGSNRDFSAFVTRTLGQWQYLELVYVPAQDKTITSNYVAIRIPGGASTNGYRTSIYADKVQLYEVSSGTATTCGDRTCDTGETHLTCPGDCPSVCPDGICDGAETQTSCPEDCGAVEPTCTDSDVTVDYPDGKNYGVEGEVTAVDKYGITLTVYESCLIDLDPLIIEALITEGIIDETQRNNLNILIESYCPEVFPETLGNPFLFQTSYDCATEGMVCSVGRCVAAEPEPVCDVRKTLNEGETTTSVSPDGVSYDVTLELITLDNEAKFIINDDNIPLLGIEDLPYELLDGATISVLNVVNQQYVGGEQSVEFCFNYGLPTQTCVEIGGEICAPEEVCSVDTIPASDGDCCIPPEACEPVTVCTDECSTGDKRCNGDVVENCGEAGDGDTCLEWVVSEDCSVQGKICSSGICVDESVCTDTCDTLGFDCGKWYICGGFVTCIPGCADNQICDSTGTCVDLPAGKTVVRDCSVTCTDTSGNTYCKGDRIQGTFEYCAIDGKLNALKDYQVDCVNNYECRSGLCIELKCSTKEEISQAGALHRIACYLKQIIKALGGNPCAEGETFDLTECLLTNDNTGCS